MALMEAVPSTSDLPDNPNPPPPTSSHSLLSSSSPLLSSTKALSGGCGRGDCITQVCKTVFYGIVKIYYWSK